MENDFVIYHKFTDYETLKEFSDWLTDAGIENVMQDNNQAYLKIVGYNELNIPYGINIHQHDFKKADEILENFYENKIPEIDRDYYLFNETDNDLLEIVNHSYDWGKLDFVVAKYILKERGVKIDEKTIEQIKLNQIELEKDLLPVSKVKIICGYILAIIFPLGAILIGLTIYYNRKLLPNGERFYLHSTSYRQHGKNIVVVSLLWFIVFFIYLIFNHN